MEVVVTYHFFNIIGMLILFCSRFSKFTQIILANCIFIATLLVHLLYTPDKIEKKNYNENWDKPANIPNQNLAQNLDLVIINSGNPSYKCSTSKTKYKLKSYGNRQLLLNV